MRFLFSIVCLLMVFSHGMGQVSPLIPVPLDTAVVYGTLDNGLTYYIRHNELPDNRADFYIVQKVGSINENESQRGLAHFLEHMAFNGTKNFPKKNIINYLQDNGVKFGTDLNAYTAFDQTVYNISNVPTQRESLIDSCLLILHDWSGFISLEDAEIDAERKVIHEEWRTSTNASLRIYDKILPKLFPNGNIYANRMPIGKMEVVDNFPYSQLREYYRQWYRPELQGIVIVGDINPQHVESKIKQLWRDIPRRETPATRLWVDVPDNTTPIVVIGRDKEMTSNVVEIKYKYDPMPESMRQSVQYLTDAYIKSMIGSMLSRRLYELTQKENPPFMGASAGDGQYIISRTKNAYSISASYRDNDWQNALTAIVRELKRAYEHGFTPGEYEREKIEARSVAQNAYKSRTERRNGGYVAQYVEHFLNSIPAPDDEYAYMVSLQLLETVTLDQINARLRSFVSHDKNLVLLMRGEDKENKQYPTENDLLEVYHQVWSEAVTPYVDTAAGEELMRESPVKGKIVKETFDKKYGAKVWTLSNGAKVYLRHSTRNKNEIAFSAVSKGGYSLFDETDYYSYSNINSLVSLGGLAEVSNNELGKILTGKQVSYRFTIDPITESISGGSTVDDIETLMQLVYLRFTTVRQDSVLFESWKDRTRSALKNREQNPMSALVDTMSLMMYGNHPRQPLPTLDMVDKVDYDRACELFKQRFANAADFSFIFVGNYDETIMRGLVESYIASLPASKKRENYDATAIPSVRAGRHVKRLTIEMETPKTTVLYNISAKVKNTQRNRIAFSIMRQVLSMMYNEQIREEEGGTYGVGVSGEMSRVPENTATLFVSFDTNEQQAETLLKKAVAIIKDLAKNGPEEEKFSQVKEYILKTRQTQTVENSYFMSILKHKLLYGNDDALTYEATLQKITPDDVRHVARIITESDDVIEVIMNGVQKQK